MFNVQYPVKLTVQSTHNNSLADLFVQTQVHLLWEAFSLATISHNPSLSIARYSFIQLSELGQSGVNENLPSFFEAARVEHISLTKL